jgi:hypothetical protein
MVRALQVLGGVVAAMIALLIFVLALLAATSTLHKLRTHEREHLEAAVQFVRERELATGGIPEGKEFEGWTREMDTKGFRFEGNGFTLDKRCGSKASEFCIYFSTGDGFVTYKSWQQSMEKVSFDDSPLPLAFGLLFAGLVVAMLSKFLLAPRTPHAGSIEGI